jgi:hypothetical protein
MIEAGDDESGRATRARSVDIVVALAIAALFAWGVLLGGWSVFAVMALFWVENVVIGVFNLAKILTSGVRSGVGGVIGALFTGAFFTVHYGMFTAVHGIFVVALFGGENTGQGLNGSASGLFTPLFKMIDRLVADPDGVLAIAAVVIAHAIAYGRWVIATREEPTPIPQLMSAPYGRIVVLHITLIAGGFLVMALNAPTLGALVLIGLKLIYDVATAGADSRGKDDADTRERVRRLLVVGRRNL